MSLELIIGPMFAGKTSALQSIIRRHEALGMKCAVYKPMSDTRYGKDFYMYSHDQSKVSALPVKYLTTHQEYEPYTISKLIVIEEGQFFDDLHEFVLKAVERDGKHVVVAGLDGDYFRKPFGQILQLIPLADRVTKLTSLCKACGDGTIGLFSFRTNKSKETVEVGGSEAYIPLCRKHYITYSESLDRDEPLPTRQETLADLPTASLPWQTRLDTCQT
jgi:thymidine kinase